MIGCPLFGIPPLGVGVRVGAAALDFGLESHLLLVLVCSLLLLCIIVLIIIIITIVVAIVIIIATLDVGLESHAAASRGARAPAAMPPKGAPPPGWRPTVKGTRQYDYSILVYNYI